MSAEATRAQLRALLGDLPPRRATPPQGERVSTIARWAAQWRGGWPRSSHGSPRASAWSQQVFACGHQETQAMRAAVLAFLDAQFAPRR